MNSCSALHTISALAPVSSHVVDHITGRLGPESNHRKQVASPSAVYTLTHVSRHSVLQTIKYRNVSDPLWSPKLHLQRVLDVFLLFFLNRVCFFFSVFAFFVFRDLFS